MDPDLGLVWPVELTIAGLPAEEIGVITGSLGPDRALDDLALLLHEWADFITAQRAPVLDAAEAIADAVPAAFRKPTADPRFEAIEAEAVRAAGAAYRRDHP